MREICIDRCPPVTSADLNSLFASAWEAHESRDFAPVLRRSLVYFTAHHHGRLVGFVNVAWDGGVHGFILDTTVHPDFRRRGIGLALLQAAKTAAFDAGLEWLHVDHEPELAAFYNAAGFRQTTAGLWRVARGLPITDPNDVLPPDHMTRDSDVYRHGDSASERP